MNRNKTILLVEDNQDDVFFFLEARRATGLTNPTHHAESGQAALDYLKGAGQFADRERYAVPFLMLLDLKLPHVSGLEVLRWVREQPALATMLVVVLTSSAQERDVDEAYQLGANSYLVKPNALEGLTDLVKAIGDYWCRRNEPPIFARLPRTR